MTDDFQHHSPALTSPGVKAYAITPHDTNTIDPIPRAIRCGTGGTLVGRAVGSSVDVTFTNVADGETIPVRFSHIRVTGTSGIANIVGLA